MASTRCCVLFSKPAEPGRVKTRLHGVLTPEQAAELHQAFLDDLVPRLAEGDFELRIAWALRSGEEPPETPGVPAFEQQGDSLGTRLYRGLERAARRFASVAAVGSDHPELETERVEEAFDRLEAGADVAIGPAADGGYYLLAIKSLHLRPEIFAGVPWGGERVYRETLERCRRLGLEVAPLETGHDVDLPSDLDRLVGAIAAGTHRCPNTERVLRRWGRLG